LCYLLLLHLLSFPTRRSSDLRGDLLHRLLLLRGAEQRGAAAGGRPALDHAHHGDLGPDRGGDDVCTRRGQPLRDALSPGGGGGRDRKSTRLNSSHVAISYAVF